MQLTFDAALAYMKDYAAIVLGARPTPADAVVLAEALAVLADQLREDAVLAFDSQAYLDLEELDLQVQLN